MASSTSRLTPLQSEILERFFAREQSFFLTGGAALAGFHLRHRRTDDLDLFTAEDDAFDRGRRVLDDLVAELGAELKVLQQAPGFMRLAVTRGEDVVIVDLVRERTKQLEKETISGIRLDSANEIMANKLNTVVSRAEERDLVDLYFLERSGLRVESAIDVALEKDGGCTPATLSWVLSQVEIPDGAPLPGGVSPSELRAFVTDLVVRFRKLAFPA
jgi:predicted nucleotidyltransferase component of viral defense system